nr:MAG TPA: hypothetical protein [Caudoviricetes sp.]
MTYDDLYISCINICELTKVYIYNEGACTNCNARELRKEYGNLKIKWFCFRADGDIEVMFE